MQVKKWTIVVPSLLRIVVVKERREIVLSFDYEV